jgi:hypothetical protein
MTFKLNLKQVYVPFFHSYKTGCQLLTFIWVYTNENISLFSKAIYLGHSGISWLTPARK